MTFWIWFFIFGGAGLLGWLALEVLARAGASGEPPPTNVPIALVVIAVISGVLALAVTGIASLF